MNDQRQYYNSALYNQLVPDFQARDEPNFAWKSVCSLYLSLPGLRGFWPMSSVDESGTALDLSGQGRALAYNGNPTYNVDDLAPYIDLDGTGDYLSRPDEAGLDILGTETIYASGVRGLTMGGWFYADALTAIMFSMGKGTLAGVAADSYFIRWRGDVAGDPFRGTVSDGLAYVGATSTVTTVINTWYLAILRYVPSTSVDMFVSNVKTSTVAAVPAALNNTAAPLTIGANATPGQYLDGRASMCFLCATALSDSIISAIYHQTRSLYGV
jgi:hypothetical protein